MPRPSRQVWVLLCVLLSACSLVTDFDQNQSAAAVDEAGVQGPGPRGNDMDAQVTPTRDTGAGGGTGGGDEGGAVEVDTGPGPEPGADCRRHEDCPSSQLCCNGACIVTGEARCSSCTQGCMGSTANACRNRECVCGSEDACSGAKPFCATSGTNSACAECRDATDCAGNTDGRTQCVAGRCAACNPTDNSGCSGNTPICNATTLTCEACTVTPDNCPGNPVCTPSGACGGCTANDAADCTSPTTPICNLTANPTVCRGCASDTECMTELSRPYCVNNQRCSPCNPSNDMGCTAGSTTPDCRLNGMGQYACQGCTNGTCPSGTFCQSSSGKCVACRNDADCDPSSATPYCDTAMGTCRGCTAAPSPTLWCSLNTLFGTLRPICHSSGRCVLCDGNQGCAAPTPYCIADPANPQRNACGQCRAGVATDCTGSTPICSATNNRCRGCMTQFEAMDCPPAAGAPYCNADSGRCVRCRLGQSGTGAGCLTNQMCVMAADGPICGQCDMDSDCPAATPICNTTTRMCRTCTTADNSACGMKITGSSCTARGRCELCETSNHMGCNDSQLCCEQDGVGRCVGRNNNRCMACGMACPQGQMCMSGMCMPNMPPDSGMPDGG